MNKSIIIIIAFATLLTLTGFVVADITSSVNRTIVLTADEKTALVNHGVANITASNLTCDIDTCMTTIQGSNLYLQVYTLNNGTSTDIQKAINTKIQKKLKAVAEGYIIADAKTKTQLDAGGSITIQ